MRKAAQKFQPITSWDEVPVIFDIAIMCRLTGWSYETVKKQTQKGELPGFKMGAGWRYRKEEVQKLFSSQSREESKCQAS